MSKIDAKLLKKMIREMIEEETNSAKLRPDELKKLDALLDEQLHEASFLRKLAPYALAGAASMGLGGKAQAADYDPIKAAGGETRTAAQMFGTAERPEAKKGKFVIVTITDTKINKEHRVSFENDGRPIHLIENEAVNYLNSKSGNSGRFMVNKDSVVTDNDDTTVGKGGSAKPEVKKDASTGSIKMSDDGKSVLVPKGNLSGGGAVSAAKEFMMQKTGQANHDTGVVELEGGYWKVPITPKVKENKVNKNLLRKLIIEHLEECGMMQSEEAEGLPPEVSSIEVDPDGYEGYMAKGNLYKMGKSATELHNLIADEENLEPWVEEKIAVAARMIDDVADYMEYAKKSKQ